MFLQLKYNNSEDIYVLRSFSKRNNVVILKGKELPENLSGFKILQGSDVIADCSEYTTRYDTIGSLDGIAYSSDGSTETEDNPLVRTPSEKYIVAMLEESKAEKIQRTTDLLEEYLKNHPLTSSVHGGKEAAYTVTLEKQTLMSNQYFSYTIEKQFNPDVELKWNATGEECEVWTEEEFLQFVVEVKQHVYPVVSHQQALEKKIKACTTIEELDVIEIDYSEVEDETTT